MEAVELHDDLFMKVFQDERTRIIGIDWKDATSSMSEEDFKAELTLFAGQVGGILCVPRAISNLPSGAAAIGLRRESQTGQSVSNSILLRVSRKAVYYNSFNKIRQS
jgi:hypothetical protein